MILIKVNKLVSFCKSKQKNDTLFKKCRKNFGGEVKN